MSEEQWQELGRRAVACKGWRWMPGMLDGIHKDRVFELEYGEVYLSGCGPDGDRQSFLPDDCYAWPDLRDPATLGCLLAMVREAWNEPTICTDASRACGSEAWTCHLLTDDYPSWQGTEAEALVAALEAAP